MATDPLKQRVHFLALPDLSNLSQLLQWDHPSTSASPSCACLSAFELEDYLHSHWSAEQFHLPVPPGLTPIYNGLTLSTWDDVVPVYVQRMDRETVQAMVLLGQQRHCKVVMILRAENEVEETEDDEQKDEGRNGNDSHQRNQQQDKRLGEGQGREPTSCPSSSSSSTHLPPPNLPQSLPLSTPPCRTSGNGDSSDNNSSSSTSVPKRSSPTRTVWKYHDLRVYHDPSDAWVSNLTKGWELISDNTCGLFGSGRSRSGSATSATTAMVGGTATTCIPTTTHFPKEANVHHSHDHEKDGDEDEKEGEEEDDDDYWGQYGDAEEEGSSGDSNSISQDQACLDDLASSLSSSSEAQMLEEDSDSDDDYWGQYGDDSNHDSNHSSGENKSTSSSNDHTDPSSTTTTTVAAHRDENDGVSHQHETKTLWQQLEEEQIKARQLRSDSLSTQVDPTMLSSILQMLVSESATPQEDPDHGSKKDPAVQGQDQDQEFQGQPQKDHPEGRGQDDTLFLRAGTQEEDQTLHLPTDPSHPNTGAHEHEGQEGHQSAGSSSLLLTTTTTTNQHSPPHSSNYMHRPASHAGSDHPREPLSPTSISNSPSYPAYCQIPLADENNDHKQLRMSMDNLIQQACRAGYTKRQLLQLIDDQFSAHERACQH
ncbi:hypothetical protein BGZ73_000983 [Actinomortierella ambigua]|nr:hypothetical protein BGZ73_000983 [Actinomortierella ambigua]